MVNFLHAVVILPCYIAKILIFCQQLFVVVALARRAVGTRTNFHNARSLQENLARSAANQRAHTAVAI